MSINVVILLLTQADEESTSAAATQSLTVNEAELITGTTTKSATKTDALNSTPDSIEGDVPAAYSLASVLFGLMMVALLVTVFWWLGGARCLGHVLGNNGRGRDRKLGKDEEK